MRKAPWTIATSPDELGEGLFGQVLLWVFEVLPFLYEKGVFPAWNITSKLYGEPPNYTVLPGVFDLAYPSPDGPSTPIRLAALRHAHVRALGGGDWAYMHTLWRAYFRVPARVEVAAARVNLPPDALGLHYRGTDKNQSDWDTNPVSRADFLTLTADVLRRRPTGTSIFVATDEFAFVEEVRQRFPDRTIVNLGEVGFFKTQADGPAKADHALLDCLLLSRCGCVLKCSSALSGFAKVLNPQLEVYRVAASKFRGSVPYFPEAYLPRLTSSEPACRSILERQFQGDWTDDPRAQARFGRPFRTRPRRRASVRLRSWLASLVTGRPV